MDGGAAGHSRQNWQQLKTNRTNFARLWLVVLYAVAMAWVESAVVFYLRSMNPGKNLKTD